MEKAKKNDPIMEQVNSLFRRTYSHTWAWADVHAAWSMLTALRGFWPMSTVPASANALDHSHNGMNMTAINTPIFARSGNTLIPYLCVASSGPSYQGRADGPLSRILGNEGYVSSTWQGMTLGGWFCFNNAYSSPETMISKWNVAGGQLSYILQRTAGNLATFGINNGGVVSVSSVTTLNTAGWNFIVGRFTPSLEVAIFIDEAKWTNAVGVPATIGNSTANFELGAAQGTQVMTGGIALPFLCASALPDSTIYAMWHISRALFSLPCVTCGGGEPAPPVYDWYVDTEGSATGSGAIDDPWDIDTALEDGGYPASSIQPGDTVCFRGGEYGTGRGNYWECLVGGDSDDQVLFTNYPGEHVILNGGVLLGTSSPGEDRHYTTWMTNPLGGIFEIYNGNWTHYSPYGSRVSRWFEDDESPDENAWHEAFECFGYGHKFINLYIHDTNGGITSNNSDCIIPTGKENLIYGCLIYNVGVEVENAGNLHHGLYANNDGDGSFLVEQVITVHNMGYGLHFWSSSGLDINNVTMFNCIGVNDEHVLGGNATNDINNSEFDECYFKGPDPVWLGQTQITGDKTDASLIDCLLWATENDFAIKHGRFDGGVVTGNTIVLTGSNDNVVTLYIPNSGASYPLTWNNNIYYDPSDGMDFKVYAAGSVTSPTTYSFSTWKSTTGYDAASTHNLVAPSGGFSIVFPNDYEDKRGNILIVNWDGDASVTIDISGLGFQNGDHFEIRAAIDYFNDTGGSNPITGTYNSGVPSQSTAVVIDMQASRWDYVRPIGASDSERAESYWLDDYWGDKAGDPFPYWGAFIIRYDPT